MGKREMGITVGAGQEGPRQASSINPSDKFLATKGRPSRKCVAATHAAPRLSSLTHTRTFLKLISQPKPVAALEDRGGGRR